MEDPLMTVEIIAASEIESELSRIWQSQEKEGKIRASLFNLIFYTKKNLRAQYVQTISQKVVAKFPSRILFITEDAETSENYLHTRASIIPIQQEGAEIACDLIQIDVGGAYKKRVPFVLLPHLLTDLPIYVVWGEDPSENTSLFQQLKKLAHRLIFDSESAQSLGTFANTLTALSKTPSQDIADLNWARMESWRELIASTFYTQERLEKLQKTSRIQILYNAQESAFCCHTQIQALYLQCWLSTQLGWKLEAISEKENASVFSYSNDKKKIEITLYPEWQAHIKAGSILSVDLETEEQDHFSFGRNLDLPHHVSMRFSTLEHCDMPLKYIFAKDESGQSLVKEICHKGTSQHFLHVLKNIQSQKEFFNRGS
jgi:hypothetical protein